MKKRFARINDRFALSAIVPALIIIFLMFGPLLAHPGHFLLSMGGDGLKNYFTYLYFIQYDFGHQFTGMGYPFDEHMIFTDNMPLLAWTFAKLRGFFPNTEHYALATMHLLMVMSFPIGSAYLYKIHRFFNVGVLWASVSAVFIAFFSPQLLRFTSHYALSFVCIIPMLLYWLMRYDRDKSIRFLCAISLFSLLVGFLHVYNMGFAFILIGAYSVAKLIQGPLPLRKRIGQIVLPLISVAIPVVIFKFYLFLTDTVTDRPQFPPGILSNCTKWENMITSSWAPLGFTLQFLVGGHASSGGEGYVYIGFVSLAALLLFVFLCAKRLYLKISKKQNFIHAVRAYRTWLIIAIICLLLAMGVPFKWGLEFLLDHVSSFRQMRSLGRFSWGFYYLIMVFVSIWIYRFHNYLRYKKKPWPAKGLLFSVAIIWAVQLSGYVTMIRTDIDNAKENYAYYAQLKEDWRNWMQEHNLKPDNFQASLGLPFFYIGADKTGVSADNTGQLLTYLSTLAIATKMPTIDVMMSRSSWSRAFAISRLMDGPLTTFNIADSFNSKPVLLVVNWQSPLTLREQAIIDNASFIDSFANNTVYALDLRHLQANFAHTRDSLLQQVALEANREGLLSSQDFYYSNHFDDGQQEHVFSGKGALGELEDQTIIDSIQVPVSDTDRNYLFSIWSLCDSVNDHLTYFTIRQYDGHNNQLFQMDASTGRSTRVEHFWFKTETEIPIKANVSKIEIMATGYHRKDNHIAIDELVLWPANAIHFYKPATGQTVSINNRPFPYSKN